MTDTEGPATVTPDPHCIYCGNSLSEDYHSAIEVNLERVEALTADLAAAERVIANVRALHVGGTWCDACEFTWPCPTARLLPTTDETGATS